MGLHNPLLSAPFAPPLISSLSVMQKTCESLLLLRDLLLKTYNFPWQVIMEALMGRVRGGGGNTRKRISATQGGGW